MKLHFTRHGESLANTLHIISNRDLPHTLTVKGREQAQTLAARLEGVPLTRIYTSPVLRARETADIVGAALTVPVEVAQGLKEYDCGILEGRGDAEAWALHRQFVQDWLAGRNRDSAPAGGESFFDIQQRVGEFISGLARQYNGSQAEILCVSHGGTLLFGLLGLFSNIDPASIQKNGFPHTILISAEWRDGQLVCARWGEIIPEKI
jgi:broad specificity phosphatase PhoE